MLVEAGPWGEAWTLWRTQAGKRETCDRLRAWCEEDPRALWDRLRSAPVPDDLNARVATWAALQFWSFKLKPVVAVEAIAGTGRVWRTHGIHPDIDAAAYAANYVAPDGRTWKRRDRRLPDLIAGLDALPTLSRVEVVHGDARSVAPIPGAVVYLDPDYQGTTGYGHSLPRADVIAVAEKHRAAGCRVAVSEAAPLPLDNWSVVELPSPVGRGRTFSAQKREWLTLSEHAPTQTVLLLGGMQP